MNLTWFNFPNLGDAINPILFEMISGEKPDFLGYDKLKKYPHYMMCGSILARATKHSTVWGTGFIANDNFLIRKLPKIHAVRGPLTGQKLGNKNPEIYGDPCLLLPEFYKPQIEKEYDLGFVPHYIDKQYVMSESIPSNVLLIDIQQNPLDVVNEILKCEKIISSSLHGLVVADAYDIPSLWVWISNKVIGGKFKFIDYMESVKRKQKEPVILKDIDSVDQLMKKFETYEIDIDLEALYNVCPFK